MKSLRFIINNVDKMCFYVIMIFFSSHIIAFSQSFSIISFSNNPNDISAMTESRVDLNGIKCGLIKVRCVLDNISFKGNVIGEVESRDGEYWVYMSKGSKNLGIYHSKLLPLEIDLESIYKDCIKSSTTYLLTLSIPEALYTSTLSQNAAIQNQNVVINEGYSNTTLSGVISDEKDKEPLIGCTVLIKNSNNGVWSNYNGEFTISDVPEKCTLEISYVGYKKKEITFTGKIPQQLNITLKSGKGVEREDYFYDPNDKSQYFDLSGNVLISRPSKKGTYIRVTDGKAEKFTIK